MRSKIKHKNSFFKGNYFLIIKILALHLCYYFRHNKMKNILIIVFLLIPFGTYAQTDRELLLELVKQQTELSKQQAITTTKVDGIDKRFDSMDKRIDTLEKSIDKRFEMQSNFMIGIMSLLGGLIAAILGFIGYILWDRKEALKPVEATTAELKKEIDLLKERETKSENFIKKLLEKHPDLAGLA